MIKLGSIKKWKINKDYPHLPQRTVYQVERGTIIGEIAWQYVLFIHWLKDLKF